MALIKHGIRAKIWSHFGGPNRRERERRGRRGRRRRRRGSSKPRYVFILGSSVFLFPKALFLENGPPLSRVFVEEITQTLDLLRCCG